MNDNYTNLSVMPLDAETIACITGGTLHKINGGYGGVSKTLSTDSRTEQENGIFAAIKGENFDGNSYISSAVKNGAAIIISERLPETSEIKGGADIIVVENTVLALGRLGRAAIEKSGIKRVAVTGSVGKTTTKEFIASVLSGAYKTHKTAGNKNNEIGLPLTALSMEEGSEFGVFECGMSGLGEIEYLSDIVRPNIAVITNIGSSHMEKLGSRENIAKAKLEIVSGLTPDGTLIINADEPLLTDSETVAKCPRVITAALHNRCADYRALNIRTTDTGTLFDLIYSGKVAANVEIPLFGTHNVYDALYAFAVGIEAGLSEERVRLGLSAYKGVSMRQKIYELGSITVIEDCYNASPESMRASIDVLASLSKRRGVRATALLGDMKELGEDSLLMHEQLGIYAARAGVRVLYTYGTLAEHIAISAIGNGVRAENAYVNLNSSDPSATGEMILSAMEDGDILLVKASRSVKAEAVIDYIKGKLK